jgi:hypothetical protein
VAKVRSDQLNDVPSLFCRVFRSQRSSAVYPHVSPPITRRWRRRFLPCVPRSISGRGAAVPIAWKPCGFSTAPEKETLPCKAMNFRQHVDRTDTKEKDIEHPLARTDWERFEFRPDGGGLKNGSHGQQSHPAFGRVGRMIGANGKMPQQPELWLGAFSFFTLSSSRPRVRARSLSQLRCQLSPQHGH